MLNNFLCKKKRFKKQVKVARKHFKQEILRKLSVLETNNPRDFWKLVKELKSSKKSGSDIDITTWKKYFQALGNATLRTDERFESKINSFLTDTMSKYDYVDLLDKPFSQSEFEKAVSNLKGKKSAGEDGILNEMLKCASKIPCVSSYILKIFFDCFSRPCHHQECF